MDFESFEKIPRLKRTFIVTEKIDGTNAQIAFPDDMSVMHVGSRKRWITPESDNFGFARWAYEHEDELRQLGPGRHYGEWYGNGIQRNYGLDEKRFALFNTQRWGAHNPGTPECCSVVPVLATHQDYRIIDDLLIELQGVGSIAVPGWMEPEGVVVYMTQARRYFKVTCKNDAQPKGQANDA